MAPFTDVAPSVTGSVLALAILGAFIFPLRVFVRISHRSWGWDDTCMVIGAFPFAALSAVCLGGAFNGIGVHQPKLSTAETQTALMWFWLFEITWCMAVVPVKVSVALTIGRLGRIATGKRPFITALYYLVWLLAVITLAGMFYIIFRCTPISYAWDTDTPGGKCQDPRILAGIYYTTTAINILVDWICALLPVWLLWNAPLDIRSKISISFLLSLGVLASVSACVRQKYTEALTAHSHDMTLGLGHLMIWGYAEIGIGFFVGSLSTLRPLFIRRGSAIMLSDAGDEQELRVIAEKQRSMTPPVELDAEGVNNLSPVSREIERHLQGYPEAVGRAR